MRDEKIISRFGGQQIVDLYNLQNLTPFCYKSHIGTVKIPIL